MRSHSETITQGSVFTILKPMNFGATTRLANSLWKTSREACQITF